jgi:hypothetical protein
MFFRIVPAVDIYSQTIRFMRSPRTGLVWVQTCSIREDGVDNGPSGLHRVLSHEQHGISMHGISQKTLLRIHLVRGLLFHCGEFCRHGHELFAGPFYLGGEA